MRVSRVFASVVGLLVATGAACASDADLAALPWLGDGQPEREGEAWYEPDPAPVFTARFVLPEGKSSADGITVRVAAPNCYVLTVNGEVSDSDLQMGTFPLWSPYDKTIYTETFTFTRGLRPAPATNEVMIALGNGWYNMPPLRFWSSICFRDHLAHGRPCFKLAIDGIDRLDWTWKPSPCVQNSFQLGEIWDLSRDLEKAEPRPASVVKGPKGRLVPRQAPPIGPLCTEGCRGTSSWLKTGEVQVVDFELNRTGVFFFWLDREACKPGEEIEFVYGERLWGDGSVNPLTQTAGQIKHGNGGPGAPKVAAQRDVVRMPAEPGSGQVLVFNTLTWHVARYVEVRGYGKLLGPDAVSMMPIGSQVAEAEPAKSFKAARPEYQAIHETCVRTFLSNLMGVQSDCPGRERLGYGGDIVATCEAFMLNFDMKEFYLKTLQDFADEAADDGWITETAPYVGIRSDGFGGRAGPISWSLAVPVMMDGIIRHYPDAKDRALAFYPVCTRYIALVDAMNPSGIIPRCIGDHEALERAPNEVTATAHWHEFVRLTAAFAKMLGKDEDATRLEALAAKIASAFQAKFVKDGVVANGSQSAQAIALYLGLVPADQIPAAEARLLKAVEEKGFAPSTGIFSTRYMLMYLSAHGHRDVAAKIVLHRGYPGWLHMIDRGATTLWETWAESEDVYSNCHPMFGSVDEWILTESGRAE